jgi:protein-S-isoprenylcysteine O-methyltransferase Ste14
MKATNWEFKNRALVFGLIFALAFQFYFLDHENATSALANRLAVWLGIDGELVAHLLLAFAAILLVTAALIRTWASAYLRTEVVYAPDIKTASLVADGPYRHVRNPLYFANLLMAIGMGAMTSRIGFFVLVLAMLGFCYRLILREEDELRAAQGQHYEQYRMVVPRFWPSLRARVPSAGGQAIWASGFKAEAWYWGFAVALVAFAITLKIKLFFWILGASLAWLWLFTTFDRKKEQSQAGGSP